MARTKAPPVVPGTRPEPPDRLREDMKEIWRETTGRMPPDWFTLEMFPVLEEYCRHVCYCRDVAGWLDQVDVTTVAGEDLKKHTSLSVKYNRYVLTMSVLATRLRLTVRSQRMVSGDLIRSVKGTGKKSLDNPWAGNGHPAKRHTTQAEAQEED